MLSSILFLFVHSKLLNMFSKYALNCSATVEEKNQDRILTDDQ